MQNSIGLCANPRGSTWTLWPAYKRVRPHNQATAKASEKRRRKEQAGVNLAAPRLVTAGINFCSRLHGNQSRGIKSAAGESQIESRKKVEKLPTAIAISLRFLIDYLVYAQPNLAAPSGKNFERMNIPSRRLWEKSAWSRRMHPPRVI